MHLYAFLEKEPVAFDINCTMPMEKACLQLSKFSKKSCSF